MIRPLALAFDRLTPALYAPLFSLFHRCWGVCYSIGAAGGHPILAALGMLPDLADIVCTLCFSLSYLTMIFIVSFFFDPSTLVAVMVAFPLPTMTTCPFSTMATFGLLLSQVTS